VDPACARTNVVGTSPCLIRPRKPSTWPHVFARSWFRPWGLEPTVRRRDQSIEPVTPPSSSEPACARFRVPHTRRSPAPHSGSARGPEGPLAPTRERDVLPAPPLGGAPHLRPFVRSPPLGGARMDLEDARSRSASRSAPCGVGQLFWGFAPRRTCSRVRVGKARGLDALRTRRPYERFTSGSTLRRRNACFPLGALVPSPAR